MKQKQVVYYPRVAPLDPHSVVNCTTLVLHSLEGLTLIRASDTDSQAHENQFLLTPGRPGCLGELCNPSCPMQQLTANHKGLSCVNSRTYVATWSIFRHSRMNLTGFSNPLYTPEISGGDRCLQATGALGTCQEGEFVFGGSSHLLKMLGNQMSLKNQSSLCL